MNVYLIAGFVLLVVMVFLVLRPFVVADPVAATGPTGTATATTDAAARARAAAKVETVAHVETATTTATERTAPKPVPAGDDVRASVEAAIAARKAALSGTAPVAAEPRCSSCESAVDPDDAFCRSCGAQQKA
jgi:hypothetical protein